MVTNLHNWVGDSASRDQGFIAAIESIRSQFPAEDSWRAWCNFEFVAEDGSINDVDLLVFCPQGFFLIEVVSRGGRLEGDAGTWTWESEGRKVSVDPPLAAAKAKAERLSHVLSTQLQALKKGPIPSIEVLVYLSARNLQCELPENAREFLCLPDDIHSALQHRRTPGLTPDAQGPCDRPTAKLVAQIIEKSGFRGTRRSRRVSDYVLERLIGEGPGYQDWQASHVQVSDSVRRIRLYLVRSKASADERETIRRAAVREYRLLESLQHPGILKAGTLTEHEAGIAILFEYDPQAIRLDHYLQQFQHQLSTSDRLELVRQIAEVIRYAHDRRVVHRALCPQSILVSQIQPGRPRIKICNWQTGCRQDSTDPTVTRGVSATVHMDRLIDDISTAYMAPEALIDENPGEYLDVFSLGAIAWHVLCGQPPAANGIELSNRLRETRGLQISSVMNGARAALQYLIQYSTHPEVTYRIDSVADFLAQLDEVDREQSAPDVEYIDDPDQAQINSVLPGNLTVLRRLGQGACSIALLVSRGSEEYVLKFANSPDHNPRIAEEAETLEKVRHPHVVELVEPLQIGDREAFLMRPVYAEKERRVIETLGQRLRKEGRLQIDLLQRFGEDLLGVVVHLEEQGIWHRDIKPDNIAVGMVGRGDKLHLVLFDFSLSRMPAENIRAGTPGYLDPLLPLRQPPRWDNYAERYAAAMTLYELAVGSLPRWGDGTTDPSQLSPQTEITIDAEQFDSGLREPLSAFFRSAFKRTLKDRFHNAEEMLRAWRDCFKNIDPSRPVADESGSALRNELLDRAVFATTIPELGLGTRASNVLDRENILTVRDLLAFPLRRLSRMRGVGNKTRREITETARHLRQRLGTLASAEPEPETETPPEQPESTEALGALSVDQLLERLRRVSGREGDTLAVALRVYLDVGIDGSTWLSQSDIARHVSVTRARIGQIIAKFQQRWKQDSAISLVRDLLAEAVAGHGGVLSLREAADALLVARGCAHDEPVRTAVACAVIRAAVEAERTTGEPRFLVWRVESRLLLSKQGDFVDYARRLGEQADLLAGEDPLAAPQRATEQLRAVPAPDGLKLSDARLRRLAAECSAGAVLSWRQEFYRRGMSAARAIRLSQGALMGPRELTIEQICERVQSRYPECATLPPVAELQTLLLAAGCELKWDATRNGGDGCFVSTQREQVSVTSGSESVVGVTAVAAVTDGIAGLTPEEADRRRFEERLQRALKDGAFLVLQVDPRRYEQAVQRLSQRYPLEIVDLEGLFLDSLMAAAAQAGVQWELVLKTDTVPQGPDWDKLLLLVARAMPAVEQRLRSAERTLLVIYPGLLARYDQMDLLARLSQEVGRANGIPGLWLLLPGDQQPLLDGRAVPLINPAQRNCIPSNWLGAQMESVVHERGGK